MKNTKKLSVTVGIPAYNEEKNILDLLRDIYAQKQIRWNLREIIVVDDHSSDNTKKVLLSFPKKDIKVISHKKRKGKTISTKDMFKEFHSDILILFDADERLKSHLVIEKFVEPFLKNSSVMLASGDKKPFPPQTFLQRGLYSTYYVFHLSKLNIKDGNNIFGCQGGCLAIRNTFAKQVNLPNVISDDAFLYLECKKRGYAFKYIDTIAVYYKLARSVSDYYRQLFRSTPKSVGVYLEKYFGNNVKEEFHRPISFYLSAILEVLFRDPLPTLFVVFLNIAAKPFIPFMAKKYHGYWQVAESTK